MTQPPWQDNDALRRLFLAVHNGGGQARLVGGCVRDWIAGAEVRDIDIATTLVPIQTAAVLSVVGFRVIPTGIDHGTVTAIQDGQTFEITTLREDVETDGRHARVRFGTDWIKDAERRDFTVNALYADLDGTVHDPLDQGLSDISGRRLNFVGDPASRIREDYLRILRFYRFAAQTGFSLDTGGRTACTALAGGMAHLSSERVWHEVRRLLAGQNRFAAMSIMSDDLVLSDVLPELHLEGWTSRIESREPIVLLAALVHDLADAQKLAHRLKLSNNERKRLLAALPSLPDDITDDFDQLRRHAWRVGTGALIDRLTVRAARDGVDLTSAIQGLQNWSPPALPVRGQDLLNLGVAKGPMLGTLLRDIENWWIERDFAPDRAACLSRLKEIVVRSEDP